MRTALPVLCLLAASAATFAQSKPPSQAQVRRAMGIASSEGLRGQQDVVGFAAGRDQMAKTWDLATAAPLPERLGPAPAPGVAAIVTPHDDYLYAGRSYRQVIPLLTAKRVVLVGVFHAWRLFGERDRLVWDRYAAWRTPDGNVPVSPLRQELLVRLPAADFVRNDTAHDREHSLEPVVAWLRHANPAVEIVPIIVPVARFERLRELADHLGDALAATVKEHGWTWGRDVALAITTDGVHYGTDFEHVPFGAGGPEAYVKAVANDKALLTGPLAGRITDDKLRQAFATFVDPEKPGEYRLTWCGRYAIPFGLMLLERTAQRLGLGTPVGHPVSYATSVGLPELPLRAVGLGETAPANLYHFVGYPALAYTLEK